MHSGFDSWGGDTTDFLVLDGLARSVLQRGKKVVRLVLNCAEDNAHEAACKEAMMYGIRSRQRIFATCFAIEV